MCRSIKVLRQNEGTPSDQEIHDAALQFVRKISGYRVPSQANASTFDAAVREVSDSSRRLLDGLVRPRAVVARRTSSLSQDGSPRARGSRPSPVPARG
ncbi:MAG TPA: DUF2277 domain-containing protein [Candidatus Angelobacter sp.]|nr:DUF2277 domain-containing protein [Candidatus Angelobacter sp.]